jgi:hypothetical protein
VRRRLLVGAAVVAGLVLVVLFATLGYDELTGERRIGDTGCLADNRNLLAAQSVPTASHVPCFGSEVAGWELSSDAVSSDGTSYTLTTTEIPGGSWTVQLRPACTPSADAVEVRPGVATTAAGDLDVVHRVPEGTTLWEDSDDVPEAEAYRRSQWYQFDGGCIESVVEVPARFDRRLILADLDRMLTLVPRAALQEEVEDDSGGQLTLDPPASAR